MENIGGTGKKFFGDNIRIDGNWDDSYGFWVYTVCHYNQYGNWEQIGPNYLTFEKACNAAKLYTERGQLK
jgi:hypothetical protein